MSAPITVLIDRLNILSELLLQMSKEFDTKKFFELDRKFAEIVALNKLEDSLNDSHNNTTF